MSAPVTTIDRLSCTYLVADGHREPAAVRSRLDALAQRHLAERCGPALVGLLDPADPSVWLIRRLEVGLALQLDSNAADLVTQAWAQHIAQRISDVVSGRISLPSDDVVWFPDRTAFLASFAVDAVAGRSSGRWEYTSLRGVSALPPGRAIVTAADGLGVSVVDVVRRLAATSRLRSLAADVHVADADHLWQCCLHHLAPQTPSSDAAHRTVQIAYAAQRSASAGQRALRALDTAFAMLSPGGTAADAIAVVADVEGAMALLAVPEVTGSDGTPVRDGAGATVATTKALGTQLHPHGAVVPPARATATDRAQTPAARTDPDGIATPFGGILRLLPVFEGLGWGQLPAAVRRKLLARCVGATAVQLAELDPVLALAAGLDEERAGPTDATAESVADVMLANLVGNGRVHGGTIAMATLPNPMGDGQVLVLRDVESSLWLHCDAVVSPRSRARALDGLRRSGVAIDTIVDDGDRSSADLAFLGAEHPAEFSVAAQVAVRLFALRLLGLGRSSVRHLVENLLDTAGVLTDLPDRFELMIQPAPLQVLLDLGGLDTFELALEWLPKPLRVSTFGNSP